MVDTERPQRWIVEAPCSLRTVLRRMGQSTDAMADGRVFVDRKRCQNPRENLRAGACVDVYPASGNPQGNVEVLDQRRDLIAVHKPAGLSTIPDQRGNAASLLEIVAKIVGEQDRTRVHATSRLDRLVSGVVVFALGRDATQAMRAARETGNYRRHYVALTIHPPAPAGGWIDAPIGRGRSPTERQVGGKESVDAQTRYETIEIQGEFAMVAAEPRTGRTHQLRVHLAHLGAPLIGDQRYGHDGQYGGASNRLVLPSGAVFRPKRIALHAAWVEVVMPNESSPWRIEAQVPEPLREIWRRCGGHADAWERALSPLGLDSASTDLAARASLPNDAGDE